MRWFFGNLSPKPQLVINSCGRADSVGANIAEGYGRASPGDHQRFIRIARGSLYEVRHFLRRADKRRLLTKEQKAPLQRVLKELLPALNAYLRSLGTHDT